MCENLITDRSCKVLRGTKTMDNKDLDIPLKLPDHRATNILSAYISHTSHFLLFYSQNKLEKFKKQTGFGTGMEIAM